MNIPITAAPTLKEILKILRRQAGVAVFDFDGVIADTEPIQMLAYERLLKEHKPNLEDFDFTQYIGNSEAVIFAMLNRQYDLELEIGRDKPRRLSFVRDLVAETELAPSYFVYPVLSVANTARILSSQDERFVLEMLDRWAIREQLKLIDHLAAYPNKFEAIPHLSELLGTPSNRLFHFEDNPRAIEISARAGHQTVFVRHALNADARPPARWILSLPSVA